MGKACRVKSSTKTHRKRKGFYGKKKVVNNEEDIVNNDVNIVNNPAAPSTPSTSRSTVTAADVETVSKKKVTPVGKPKINDKVSGCLKCLSPNFMVESQESCELMFEKILEKLIAYKQLSGAEADASKLEYSNFLSTVVKKNKDLFIKFDKEVDRVDVFIWKFFNDTKKFTKLQKVLKMLLILSHGQATVERGFSVNGKLLVENLHSESLIAQRHIHDHMRSNNLQSHNLDVTRQLLDSVKLARKRYFASLQEKSSAKEASVKSTKLAELNEEILKLNTEVTLLKSTIIDLSSSSDKAMEAAQKKQTLTEMRNEVEKANALKRAANEKQENLDKTLAKKKILVEKKDAL